jgi:hypothetical protein
MTDVDDALDQVLSYPTDELTCLVCGRQVVTFPEGLFHADTRLDWDHAPQVLAPGGGVGDE